jgi:hypothetical protein
MTARNLIAALRRWRGTPLGSVRPSFATAGLAEWEITTPGGHLISHIDPLRAHGTCLRKRDGDPRPHQEQTDRILVPGLEWWTHYVGTVAGRARGPFFFR